MSRQSVQALAASLMGLGDRVRGQSNTEKSQAMAQRYQNLTQEKFKQEQITQKTQMAHQAFIDNVQLKTTAAAAQAGVTPDKINQEEIAKNVFRDLPPDMQALLPGFKPKYQPAPYSFGEHAPGSGSPPPPTQSGPKFTPEPSIIDKGLGLIKNYNGITLLHRYLNKNRP